MVGKKWALKGWTAMKERMWAGRTGGSRRTLHAVGVSTEVSSFS